jgi:anti-sigma factor RsiW
VACRPERVTAYVDRELSGSARVEIEIHLAACPACAGQACFEMDLAARLRALPSDTPPPELATRILGWGAGAS